MEYFHALALVVTIFLTINPVARGIGINYGLLGDNLPSPFDAIAVLKSRGVQKIRLFEPNPDVLAALQGSGIAAIVGTRNEDLQALAADPSASRSWVDRNVVPYASGLSILCISAGNEVIPGELAQYVPGAMQNLAAALEAANLGGIQVSTTVSMAVLQPSFPPSQGVFSPETTPVMTQIVSILAAKNSPLLVNVYPYFPRAGEPEHVSLDYALLQSTVAPVPDGPLTYYNLFDAMVDTVYAALEKIGGENIEIVVSETGWPTEGGTDASIGNAQIYVNNLIGLVSSGQGTPRRPNKNVDTYIFAFFNEDLKPEGTERHWGLYYPDLTEVYHANL
ncbi:putative glucan endo-1,3-beta-glucosidase GVI [Primulina eburnea]|uniref:putative glucan endo-1,3-beta-glucosidase GVI n=2 Tax=Primulina eburnea TaxID=1245227 RepID=UPI003C6C0E62